MSVNYSQQMRQMGMPVAAAFLNFSFANKKFSSESFHVGNLFRQHRYTVYAVPVWTFSMSIQTVLML